MQLPILSIIFASAASLTRAALEEATADGCLSYNTPSTSPSASVPVPLPVSPSEYVPASPPATPETLPLTCTGDQVYVGWPGHVRCECPNGQIFVDIVGFCSYPVIMPPTSCAQSDQITFCLRDEDDYCKFDIKDKRCHDDGYNRVACYPPQGPTKDTYKYVYKPTCPQGQNWNYKQERCACPPKQVYDPSSKSCDYPVLSVPSCGYGELAYCAVDKKTWVAFDSKAAECRDNGRNIAFCSARPKEWCETNWQQ